MPVFDSSDFVSGPDEDPFEKSTGYRVIINDEYGNRNFFSAMAIRHYYYLHSKNMYSAQ